MMSNYLVISIIAKDSPGLAEQFSTLTSQNNCNIEDSRMAVMGQEFSATLFVSGSDADIKQCEQGFLSMAETSGHLVVCRHTKENEGEIASLPYAIQTISLDAPGLIRSVTDFLNRHDINISNLIANSYKAPHTGAPMLEIQLTANIPSQVQISSFREEFADFCDELQIDAAFEPIK